MKKLTSIIIAAITLVLCFALAACGTKYRSKYNASTIESQKTPTNASVSFGNFSGTYVIKWNENIGGEVFITYQATLKEGSIKVYYDFLDEKKSMFEIGPDGSAEGKTETFTWKKEIYVIIESDGKCNEGSFSFTLEKAEK